MNGRQSAFSVPVVHVLLLSVIGSSAGKTCDVAISELKLGLPDDPREFIELRKHCNQAVDLSSYILVLWSGGKNQDEPVNLTSKAQFSKTPCLKMTQEYFLLTSPEPQTSSRQDSPNSCSFEQLGTDWTAGPHYWINMGNERTNALVLYDGSLNENLNVGDLLTDDNAYRNSIVDLVFYGNKAGERIRRLLFPKYFVGKPGTEQNDYFRLNPKFLKESKEKVPSFSFCCPDENITRQWPLAFKVAEATPGLPNACSNAKWVLDSVQGHFRPDKVNRCVKAEVEQFHEDTEPKFPEESKSSQAYRAAPWPPAPAAGFASALVFTLIKSM